MAALPSTLSLLRTSRRAPAEPTGIWPRRSANARSTAEYIVGFDTAPTTSSSRPPRPRQTRAPPSPAACTRSRAPRRLSQAARRPGPAVDRRRRDDPLVQAGQGVHAHRRRRHPGRRGCPSGSESLLLYYPSANRDGRRSTDRSASTSARDSQQAPRFRLRSALLPRAAVAGWRPAPCSQNSCRAWNPSSCAGSRSGWPHIRRRLKHLPIRYTMMDDHTGKRADGSERDRRAGTARDNGIRTTGLAPPSRLLYRRKVGGPDSPLTGVARRARQSARRTLPPLAHQGRTCC